MSRATAGAMRTGSRARLATWAFVSSLAALGYFEMVPCPFAAFLSLPCPGCGLSRAARHLLAGELEAALALHPLSPLVVPLVAAALFGVLHAELRGSTLHSAPRSGRLRVVDVTAAVLAVLLIGTWLARFWGAFGGPVPVR